MSNPLGFPDHRPFLGFSDELIYGLSDAGEVRHISVVQRGLKCACFCPACDRPLVAKKGIRQIHHFAHHGHGEPCSHVAETNAHLWAKQVLERVKRLTIPEVAVLHRGRKAVASPAREYLFATTRLEKKLGAIVPDVILETNDGAQLIVEVRVTHPCDFEKIEKLRSDNLSAIEIDLRRFRTSTDREAVEKALLTAARRHWLHNARIPHFENKLLMREARQRVLEQERAEARERLEAERKAVTARQEALELARDLDRLVRTVRRAGNLQQAATGPALREEDADILSQFGPLVEFSRKSVGFSVPDQVWRAELARHFLTYPDALVWEGESITVEHALRVISDHVLPGFATPLTPELRERLDRVFPGRLVPAQAVELFLDEAFSEGYLDAGHGSYTVDEGYARSLVKTAKQERAYQSRRDGVLERTASIVSAVPRLGITAFDLQTWFTTPQRDTGLSPDMLCRSNHAEQFRSFSGRLKAIEEMMNGGEAAEHLLALPLHDVVEKVHIRKRDAALQAAASRRREITAAAYASLEEEAEVWLSGPSEDDEELSRIDFSGDSQQALSSMHYALGQAARARRALIEARELAQACRAELRSAASRLYSGDHLDLFLSAFDPRIGAAPERYCTDRATLDRCLALLRIRQRKAKRRY